MQKVVLWLGATASVLIIGGQILAFFVNLNTLKEQRVNQKLKQVTA